MIDCGFHDLEETMKKELKIIPDVANQDGELIRLICKGNKHLLVTRSLLMESSSYFAAMLGDGSGWQETSDKAIELGTWSRNDLATILSCIESKETEAIFKDVNRLFRTINYFSISPLVEQCIEFKIANVSVESVIDDVRFAEHYSIGALKDKCVEFLLKRLPERMQCARWRRKMYAELLQQLLRHEQLEVHNEDEVLSLIDLWSSSGNRQSERKKLLHEVRFARLTAKAFNKCSQDPQCLEVPQFRVLLETRHWSDLNENFLVSRNCHRMHLHTLGFLEWPLMNEVGKICPKPDEVDGVLLYCSERGTQRPPRGALRNVSAEVLVKRSRSVISGNGVYVCQRVNKLYLLPGARLDSLSGFEHFSDFCDSKPSSTTIFPKKIFILAPPTVFEGDLYIAHLVLIKEPTPIHDKYYVRPEHFEELEISRYHGGETRGTRRLRMSSASRSWKRLCCNMLSSFANKLIVSENWTILCVPRQGSLLVIDSPNSIGPIIEIPEEVWNFSSPSRIIVETYCDIVIVGNVAYVLLRFCVALKLRDDREGCAVFLGSELKGSITAYDLDEGKFIPGQMLDLEPLFEEVEIAKNERFDLYLKVVESKIFLIGLAKCLEVNSARLPAVRHFVYRVESSADRLSIILVRDTPADNGSEEDGPSRSLRWKGIPLNVDAYPCVHATMLQVKASQESDPVRREKLRRFIW